MLNWKNKIFIIIIGLILLTPPLALAENADLLRMVSLRIDPSYNSAKIIWSTNYETTGRFDFGLTNALGSWLEDKNLQTYHKTVLGGLIAEQTYYFKLTVTDILGRMVISDIYNFETTEEDD